VTRNAILWDVMPCGFCQNRCFRGTYQLHQHGDKNWWARNVSSNQQLNYIAKKYYRITYYTILYSTNIQSISIVLHTIYYTILYILFIHSALWLIVTANVVPILPILVTLMMEMICSSKMSVPTVSSYKSHMT
jgi:hypothetical protein